MSGCRRCSGRLIHSVGPTVAKQRSPNWLRDLLTKHVRFSADRRGRQPAAVTSDLSILVDRTCAVHPVELNVFVRVYASYAISCTSLACSAMEQILHYPVSVPAGYAGGYQATSSSSTFLLFIDGIEANPNQTHQTRIPFLGESRTNWTRIVWATEPKQNQTSRLCKPNPSLQFWGWFLFLLEKLVFLKYRCSWWVVFVLFVMCQLLCIRDTSNWLIDWFIYLFKFLFILRLFIDLFIY